MQIATHYFVEHITRIDAVFDRYIGEDSIKAVTPLKRLGKQNPIRKLIEGAHVPLPQVWSTFIALDENKADLARFLSYVILIKAKTYQSDMRWLLEADSYRCKVNEKRSNHVAPIVNFQMFTYLDLTNVSKYFLVSIIILLPHL